MSDELREAAERRRKPRSLVDVTEANNYGQYYVRNQEWTDLNKLADAFCDEHPADDDTPIDEAWLLAVGAVRSVTVPDSMRISHDDDIYFIPQPDRSWMPAIQNGLSQWIKLRRITTRGQLRRLCSALGIELKEGKQ